MPKTHTRKAFFFFFNGQDVLYTALGEGKKKRIESQVEERKKLVQVEKVLCVRGRR